MEELSNESDDEAIDSDEEIKREITTKMDAYTKKALAEKQKKGKAAAMVKDDVIDDDVIDEEVTVLEESKSKEEGFQLDKDDDE